MAGSISLAISLASVRAGGGGIGWPPSITSSDGDPASLVDNGDGTFDVVINSVTVGTITQAQINAGGWITVVPPEAGMNVDGVTVEETVTGYVIYVGNVSIETDVEVLANGAVVGTALPFDATAYPFDNLTVRWTFAVGFGSDLIINSVARAVTLWTPADLATAPRYWFDAADADTITLNGGDVSAWGNKGSVGGSIQQTNPSEQPTLVTNGIGGLPSLSLNRQEFFSTAIDMSAAWRLYAVIDLDPYVGNFHFLIGHVSGATQGTYVPLSQSGSTTTSVIRVNNVNTTAPINVYVNGSTISVANRGEMNNQFAGSARVFSLRSLPAYNLYSLFGRVDNTNNRPEGFAGEIIMINESAVGAGDDDLIVGYLAWKWGLEASLPGGHPYASAPPLVA